MGTCPHKLMKWHINRQNHEVLGRLGSPSQTTKNWGGSPGMQAASPTDEDTMKEPYASMQSTSMGVLHPASSPPKTVERIACIRGIGPSLWKRLLANLHWTIPVEANPCTQHASRMQWASCMRMDRGDLGCAGKPGNEGTVHASLGLQRNACTRVLMTLCAKRAMKDASIAKNKGFWRVWENPS